MALTLVGTNSAAAATVTIPAHQQGDLLVFFAYRSGSTTPPTLPAGKVSLATQTGTTQSCRVGYIVATGTGDVSGTWTNATELCVHVLRPSTGFTAIPGQIATSSSTTTTITFPALTLADSSGNSWVLGFVGSSNTSQTDGTAPSGMTNRQHVTGASHQAASNDTNGGVSSWSAHTITAGTGNSVSATLEIVLAPSTTGLTGLPSNVYQHRAFGSQAIPSRQSGNSFKLPVPKITGAGNCGVWCITNDGGATVSSVSGSANGSYGTAFLSATGGGLDSHMYVLANLTGGQETVTFTFSANVSQFTATYTEYYGVATASVTQGSSSVANSTTIGAGSFTPTNNNSTGGNVIHAFFSKCDTNPTVITRHQFAGANFTLLSADSSWAGTQELPKTAETFVQTTSAAINPAITSMGDTADNWNSMAVALKVSSGSGTSPPSSGIQYNKMDSLSTNNFPANGTFVLQAPAFGNLRMVNCVDPNMSPAITVTDSEGNTWTGDGTSGGQGPTGASAGIWFLPNASPNPNLLIFINTGSGTNSDVELTWRFRDFSGAATSPFDSAIECNDTLAANASTYTPTNTISPSNTNGVVVADIGLLTGPGLTVTSPSGANWELSTFTGETDQDTMENADIGAHFHNTASGAETFTFGITSQTSNSTSGGIIAFKAAPAGAALAHLLACLGAGA